MAGKFLTKELIGKTVITGNGTILGTLDEMVVDTDTGEVKYILVRSDAKHNPGQKIDSKGRHVYAFSKMIVGEKNVTVS